MVTDAQLEEAHALSLRERIRIGEALVRMGVLDQDRLAWALGVQFELTYVDLNTGMIDWPFVRHFPLARLRELRLLPMSYAGGTIHAVVADPAKANLDGVSEELFAGRELLVQLADEDQIIAMLDEARRQQLTPRDAFAPTPTLEDADAWIDACIEMLAGGETKHRFVVVEQDRHHPQQFQIIRPNVEPEPPAVELSLARAILERLPAHFTEEFALPGGFAGITHPASTNPRAAVRVTSLHGSQGRVVVFERIPDSPPVVKPLAHYRITARDPLRTKAALARLGCLYFEPHTDCILAGASHQFATPFPPLRSVLCRRLAPAFTPAWIVWEAQSSSEAEFAPIGCVEGLIVVQRNQDASRDIVEPLLDSPASGVSELEAVLEEAKHGR
jgi:hypothetical protein